jgi:CheY-like chemotaxis protein
MLHLARSTELAPEGATFADACMAAAASAANNPERIAALVKQLTEASPEARTIARNDLAAAGPVGATAALEALARETEPQRRAALVEAIELMHPLVNAPLLAMLTTNDANLRADVAAILQCLAVPQAVPLLPTDTASAERALRTAIKNYQHGTPPFAVDADGQVELWKWDDANKKLSAVRLPADKAQVIWIARLATELAHLQPDDYAAGKQALVLRLEAAGLAGGAADMPASATLAQGEPQLLNEALAKALRSNYSHAALALVQAIAHPSDASVLTTPDGKPSPLAAALDSPSRRVRFAALQAMMALNPTTPYPGSSRVPDAIMWFTGGTGDRQAVVAMPTIAAASDLAGKLAAHGLAVQAANRARDAVDMARAMPDLEMIFIDMSTIMPDIRQALYELRISPATGNIPIALLAADGRLDDAKRLAAEHTLVFAVPRPHTPEAVTSIVENLTKLAGRDAVPAKERAAQAAQAKKWLAALRSGNHSFYTFRRTALFDLPSTPRAVAPAAPSSPAPADEALPSP